MILFNSLTIICLFLTIMFNSEKLSNGIKHFLAEFNENNMINIKINNKINLMVIK